MPTGQQSAITPLEEFVKESRFIFRGRVQRLRASTMAVVPISDTTAIVRIDEILQAPALFADLRGRDITVQLASGSRSVKEEQEAVFFTNGWLYGDSVAVVEVGHLAARQGGPALRQQIADLNRAEEEDALRGRVDLGQLVIVGRVIESRPAPEAQRGMPQTEHDPDWWEAVIEVESVEKGKIQEKALRMLFPNSTDEMWIESPKFRQGDEGIWILQRDQQEKGWPSMRRPGYTALLLLDFQPKHRLEVIRSLAK